MGLSWWKLHLKILIQWLGVISRCEPQQWLQWCLYVKHTPSSGCWIELDEQCADNCPHSLYGQWVPNPVTYGNHQQLVNLWIMPKPSAGSAFRVNPFPFSLVTPICQGRVLPRLHRPKCLLVLSLSLHYNWVRLLGNLQASNPFSCVHENQKLLKCKYQERRN